MLAPQQLPPPTSGTRNPVGRQVHQVEIRSGGTIAFRIPLWQKMAVGAFSGVLGTVAIFPIDTVKTRLQLASVQSNTGIRGIVQDVLGRYGVRGFYRGLPPTAVFVAPEKAIKLGVNDYLRDVLCGWDRTKETVLQQIAAGALTACVQMVVTNVSRIDRNAPTCMHQNIEYYSCTVAINLPALHCIDHSRIFPLSSQWKLLSFDCKAQRLL